MTASISEVQAAVRAKAEAEFTTLPMRWPNETRELPDEPTAFVYVEVAIESTEIAGFGGGRGQNLHRQNGRIEAQVLMIQGLGIDQGLGYAEEFAAVFRSFRSDTFSCFTAAVFPGTGDTDDGNYNHVATVIADLQFDQIG